MAEIEFTAEQVRSRLWLKLGRPPRFLHDILHGNREPTGEVLKYLGLERVVVYRIPKKRTALNTRGDV